MDEDIRKEAKILSMMAMRIAKGETKVTEEQAQMIITLNNQLYRKRPDAKQNEDIEK